jgi:hypothetical protein
VHQSQEGSEHIPDVLGENAEHFFDVLHDALEGGAGILEWEPITGRK